MDFDLSDEQLMFRNLASEFAEREILPVAKEDDKNEYFRPEVIQKMASLGLLGVPIPQKYGGLGAEYITYLFICEEIAKASAAVFTTCLTVHTSLFQMPILHFGTEEQKQRYLPRTTKGELLGCFGMTEPKSSGVPRDNKRCPRVRYQENEASPFRCRASPQERYSCHKKSLRTSLAFC